MIKRITALLVCLIMLMTLPISAFAAETGNEASTAPTSVRFISSGEIIFGTATLYDADGNELPLAYAYSPRITISESIAGQLTELLSECGFSLPSMNFDYQLVNMQSFFVVRVTDGQALARIIDAMMSRSNGTEDDISLPADAADAEVSTSDVSASDVSSSDVSGSDITLSDSFVPSAENDTDSTVISTTSLHSLLLGTAAFEVHPTLEASLANAFPEFNFAAPETVALPQTLNSVTGIVVAPDGMTAQVTVMPEPEYVEREVFGEVFQVLMVSSAAYSYDLSRYDVTGTSDGASVLEKPAEPVVVSPSDTTAATSETDVTTTTTTVTATEIEETTATTTTATTTSAYDDDNDGYPCEGVVSTTWKRLNLRTGPGLDYDIIARLNKGTLVTVLDYDENAGWYKIKLDNGTTGWCTDEYITLK